MKNYYGILPANIRYSKVLSSQCKILFCELTSMIDSNNQCIVSAKELSETFDWDLEGIERILQQLEKENFILAEKVVEQKSIRWKISLLFPERIILKNDEPKKEVKTETVKPIKELSAEEKLRTHFTKELAELQEQNPKLDIYGFELKNWDAKLFLKFKERIERDPEKLLAHFKTWIKSSRNLKADVTDI